MWPSGDPQFDMPGLDNKTGLEETYILILELSKKRDSKLCLLPSTK